MSGAVARDVQEAWPTPSGADDKRATKHLTRTFTVGQLYETVLEVAAEHMSKEDFDAFVGDLTDRLAD